MTGSVSRRAGTALAGFFLAVALSGLLLPWAAGRWPALDPERVDLSLEAASLPPFSGPHLLGTDDQGRDCAARLAAGAWRTLGAALAAVSLACLVGVPLGLVAGFAGGTADLLLMRGVEVLMAFPGLVLAIAIVSVLGPSLGSVVVATGLVGAPAFARLARAAARVEAAKEYVAAARALGASAGALLFRHILPNAAPPLGALATLSMGTAVLEIAGLGFLGLGVEPGVPEWGTDVSLGRNQFLTAPWTVLVPGTACALAVLGFNLLGDSLQERKGR